MHPISNLGPIRTFAGHARKCRASALLGMALLGTAVGCIHDRNAPVECVVWTQRDGVINGHVYLEDGRASFSQGASQRDVGYLSDSGHVVVAEGRELIDAAIFDGHRLEILYIKDSKFRSEPIRDGHVVLRNKFFRTEFRYNSACSVTDAAVGAVALMTLVFPPGTATVP